MAVESMPNCYNLYVIGQQSENMALTPIFVNRLPWNTAMPIYLCTFMSSFMLYVQCGVVC